MMAPVEASATSPPAPTGATRSTVVAISTQTLSVLVNVGVAVVLARLLSPTDFGLVGIALALTSAFEFARHGGMIVPAVQADVFTLSQQSTLFWFNAALGLVLTVAMAAVSPLLAWSYAEPRLAPILAWLSLIFLCSGLSAQHLAMLRRNRRFTAIAVCEFTSLLLAGAAAIWLASHGGGVWSLVVFQLGREMLQALSFVATSRWRPSRPGTFASVAPLVQYGRVMMIFELLGYLNFKADNVIVGWRLGAAALGFYAKAYELVLLPVSQVLTPLSTVVHSSLSRLQRNPTAYREFLLRALLVATGLGLPITAFLFANAEAVIVQILGAQWQHAVPIYRALAPAAATLTITACTGWVFLSLNRAHRQLRWAGLTTALTVAAFVVGTQWGARGVAIALSTARVALLVPTLIFTCHGTFMRWTDLLTTAARPAAASAAAMLVSLALDEACVRDAWALPRNALAFATTYIVCWTITPTGRALFREGLAMTGLRPYAP